FSGLHKPLMMSPAQQVLTVRKASIHRAEGSSDLSPMVHRHNTESCTQTTVHIGHTRELTAGRYGAELLWRPHRRDWVASESCEGARTNNVPARAVLLAHNTTVGVLLWLPW
ncbi:hypothetical protein J6590_060869, partial [Homalodisca vitripennis]